MTEPVRLIIWDLDDTFWRGTLSEGPIEYVEAHHEIVAELARRGIVSAICSKNDAAAVETVLAERGIWDSFVFPSINWDAKGPRIKALIEAVQLRPETVLFVDDNPMNLNEAKHFVPGIQTADETIIARLLDDPLCRGKDDADLRRLAQYKLLERRKADEASVVASGATNHDFLRASNIRVAIDYDIETKLDRAIELINRTNQLNFTKSRLPEDIEEAREKLRSLIHTADMIAGIVRVADDYGDYGDAGFFVLKRTATTNRLVHFCFSCRTLNMGIETWVYRDLAQPTLRVVGEVVNDVRHDETVIDWITRVDPDSLGMAGAAIDREFDEVRLVGSCDLRPLEHYFGEVATRVEGALTMFRDGYCIRPDHSVLLRYAAQRPPAAFIDACRPLGYRREDFRSYILKGEGRRIFVFSFMADLSCPVYVHNETGAAISLRMGRGARDLATLPLAQVSSDPKKAERIVAHLARHFTFEGRTSPERFEENLRLILSKVDAAMPIFILLPDGENVAGERIKFRAARNKLIRRIGRDYPNVTVRSLGDYAREPGERYDMNHFDRIVYHRVYQGIVRDARAWFGRTEAKGSDGSGELAAAETLAA